MKSVGYALYDSKKAYAFVYMKKNIPIALDLHLFRPEPKLIKNKIYNIEIFKHKIKINNKNYNLKL